MHGNTIRVEIRRRHGQQNGFLLHPRQGFLGKQNPAHCFQLRLQQVGPQSLSAEKVRYESMTLLNDGKRCKRLGTEVWCGHIGSLSLCPLMSVGQQTMGRQATRLINSRRAKLSRSKIWLWP